MTPPNSISQKMLLLMAFACGACVANIVYAQPLLIEIQRSFGGEAFISDVKIAWIPTLTQIGYALGMLFIVPLGDRFERRRMIFIFTLASAGALFAFAFSPTFYCVAFASLLIGLLTMTPQLLIPFAAHLATSKNRGRIIGTMMSGLLLGILLGRSVAGFVGTAIGWRAMFASAGSVLFILAFWLRAMLPISEPTFTGNYRSLIYSVFHLIRTEPVLREAMLFGGMLFAAFNAFWATIIQLVSSDAFHLGARTVGLFGLLGAGGALAASVSGRLADQQPPRFVTGLGIAVTALAFVLYALLGAHSLIALCVGVFVMDVGVQAGHIANQSRVFAINEHARSRLNTAYMFCYFLCGGIGSYMGSLGWDYFGWTGVCVVALGFLAVGGGRYFWPSSVEVS